MAHRWGRKLFQKDFSLPLDNPDNYDIIEAYKTTNNKQRNNKMQIRSTAFGMTKTENGVKWAIWINGEIVAYANDKNHARNKLRILEKLYESK